MRKFEAIPDNLRKTEGTIKLPQRMTEKSAGYDFFANTTSSIKPNEIVKVWTDVRAFMNDDEVLILDVRSSMGGRFMLANTIGIIDADYVNAENGGNIGLFLKNISDKKQTILKGDRVGQGIFLKYLTTDDDNVHNKRKGGFGSTNEI